MLQRGDLPKSERIRAQYALAQDFMKAGLFDRAEDAYRALEGTPFETEARLALLSLLERSRDWRAAIAVAEQLERSGTASFAARISHFWCELALEAEAAGKPALADEAVRCAHETAPQAARPLVLAGQRAAGRGDHAAALEHWSALAAAQPLAFNLVTAEYARSALAAGQRERGLAALQALYQRTPTVDLLEAIAQLETDPERRRARLLQHLKTVPSLSAAQALLNDAARTTLDDAATTAVSSAVQRAARPLHRYRCAACGFEAEHYFWQCPGCLSWDTYPPQRLEDL
ncbi:MAG TPA: lipopolysaccharide assembly protein LapB [Planctomycetota bacterium]|nr:lipopolysaccharide assembly protein LapB [Planctomycetota bacterium]